MHRAMITEALCLGDVLESRLSTYYFGGKERGIRQCVL